jgi:hypothetical protein
MGGLRSESAEASITDDFRSPEVLELCGIGTSFRAKTNQLFRPFQIAVMVGGDIGNKIGRVF